MSTLPRRHGIRSSWIELGTQHRQDQQAGNARRRGSGQNMSPPVVRRNVTRPAGRLKTRPAESRALKTAYCVALKRRSHKAHQRRNERARAQSRRQILGADRARSALRSRCQPRRSRESPVRRGPGVRQTRAARAIAASARSSSPPTNAPTRVAPSPNTLLTQPTSLSAYPAPRSEERARQAQRKPRCRACIQVSGRASARLC